MSGAVVLISFASKLKLHRNFISSLIFNYGKICNKYKITPLICSVITKYYAHSFGRQGTITKKTLKSQESYQAKDKLIQQMNFKCNEDARPFYSLTIPNLLMIYKVTKQDEKSGFCENRLYYIANRIKCQPLELNNAVSKRLFVYTLTFDWLEKSLNVLLEMGVPGDRIKRDLWVLKYHHETIKQRLQMVKDLGRDRLYPWMVRCSEDILIRSIKISQDTKDILGDNTTKQYLAERLNTTTDVIEDMCVKIPYLRYIRVTKVKSFLDFLFEQGFRQEDIVNKPRVLASSQATVAERLAKLRSCGINNVNLNILCRSRKEFKKYCNSVILFGKE